MTSGEWGGLEMFVCSIHGLVNSKRITVPVQCFGVKQSPGKLDFV